MELNTAPLELYIHIPFCTSKCAYCDFVSFPVGLAPLTAKIRPGAAAKLPSRYIADASRFGVNPSNGAGAFSSSVPSGTIDLMEVYTDALVSEIKARGNVYKNRPISSIYIGGGTPSVLPDYLMERVIQALFDSFSVNRKVSRKSSAKLGSSFRYAVGLMPQITNIREDYEFSIEVNPGTVSIDKLKMYREMGINRLSIGLQSPDDRDLLVLGRRHSFSQFEDAFEWARKEGFKNINIDLMQSLPGQDVDRWMRNLQTVLSFMPEHVSAYALTLEKGTPFYNSRTEDKNGNIYIKSPGGAMIRLPDDSEDRRIYRVTKDIMEEYGYSRYEISNYALAGKECVHNIGYWRRQDYLGLGLNSSSMVANIRWMNTADLKEYIEGCRHFAAGEDAVKRNAYRLSVEDQMAEFMFLGLRMTEGISKQEFLRIFSVNYDDVYGKQTRQLMEMDLIELKETEYTDPQSGKNIGDTRAFLTDLGVDVSNVAMSYFLPD